MAVVVTVVFLFVALVDIIDAVIVVCFFAVLVDTVVFAVLLVLRFVV